MFEDAGTRMGSAYEESRPTMVSIDFEGGLKVYCGPKNIISIDVMRLQSGLYRPLKEGSMFDMGYGYAIKRVKNRVAFTFDEGLIILKTND